MISLRAILLSVLAAALLSCSPGDFRDSADRQVHDLIRDREKQALGYDRKVEVCPDIPTRPPKHAYAKIPTSPLPPPTASPIERQQIDLPIIPLGPETFWKESPPPEAATGPEILNRLSIDGVALGPPAPDDARRRFDLFGVIEYAVQHSRAYQDQMEVLYLAALDVTLERHLLSPRPFAEQSVTFIGGQAAVDYRAALTVANSIGVRQKLPYGGEIVARGLVDFVNALNDNATSGETAALVLSGSLPLLRGAGMINLEGLISAERQLVYQVRAFENYRRSFVVVIASQYFQILAQQQGVFNRRLNLANLATLTERTQALYDAGRISFLEVQRSLQSRLSAENSLINAEESFQNSLDNFKVVLGMPITEPLDLVPVELDITMPTVTPDEAIVTAVRYRLDLRTAADQVEDAQRDVKNAENGLLPNLDLVAEGRVGNEVGDPVSRIDGRTSTYSAGARLDWPLDRLPERNIFRRALIGFYRAQRSHAALRDTVEADVRDTLRTMRAAETTLRIQRRGIELAQRRLEFSNELLRQGRVNARDVVESQSSLLDAQDQYERARSQLQIRILEYLRNTGTLRLDPQAGSLGRAMAPPE